MPPGSLAHLYSAGLRPDIGLVICADWSISKSDGPTREVISWFTNPRHAAGRFLIPDPDSIATRAEMRTFLANASQPAIESLMSAMENDALEAAVFARAGARFCALRGVACSAKDGYLMAHVQNEVIASTLWHHTLPSRQGQLTRHFRRFGATPRIRELAPVISRPE